MFSFKRFNYHACFNFNNNDSNDVDRSKEKRKKEYKKLVLEPT